MKLKKKNNVEKKGLNQAYGSKKKMKTIDPSLGS